MSSNIIGTYQIINTLNQKTYVGSSDNIVRRWKEHKKLLEAGTHHNKHLQAAWILYKSDAFQFHIIETADTAEQALQDEQQLLNALWDNSKTCYNSARDATAPMRGRKRSPEHTAKLVATRKGKKHSPEWCAAISAGQTGKKRGPPSPETRAKIGAAMSAALKGKKHSPETRAKISAARKGKKYK